MALVFPQVNRIIYEVTSVLVEQPRGEGESTLTKIERKIVEEAGIWLDGGLMFGPEGAGFQRINSACPWSTLEEGLQRLHKAFK